MKNLAKNIFSLPLLFLLSCSAKRNFINHDRWKPDDLYRTAFLKGKPREVKIYTYTDLDDSSLHATAKKAGNTEIYVFDESGNNTNRKVIMDSTNWFEFRFSYSDNGISYDGCAHDTSRAFTCFGNAKRISQRIDDSSFLVSYFRDGQKGYVDTVIFSANGRMTTIRTLDHHPASSSSVWYEGDRVVKETGSDRYGMQAKTYYYNSKGMLDSITYSNPLEKEFFMNNEQGDPLVYYHTLGGDTIRFERNRYEYDARGNWVRRLSYRKANDPQAFMALGQKYPNFSLEIREITY